MISMLLVLISLCSVVLAYFTSSDKDLNLFKVGACNTVIEEKYDPPDKLEPGCSFTKNVKIRNIGPSDCFIRVKAVYSDYEIGKYCYIDWNTTDYKYNSDDGYYYYKEKLKAGEVTESLFTTVKLNENIISAEIKDFDILIYSEAYEADKADNYEDVWN